MINARIPSQHLPDYLKLDLQVGTDKAAGLCLALDQFCFDLSSHVFASLWQLIPDKMGIERVREVLNGCGLACTTLKDSNVFRLFDSLREIRNESHTIKGLSTLAHIYFGKSVVRRGHQPAKGKGARDFVLADSTSSLSKIFVRTKKTYPKEQIHEFEKSAKLFLPQGMTVKVVGPKRLIEKQPPGLDLSQPCHLIGRRL